MDVLTPEQRKRNMKAIKSHGTKMEIRLTKALWAQGLRYRKNDKRVFGRPDISFSKKRIAIFIDSEYFHGKNWDVEKYRIKTNRQFWWNKIESNIVRDRLVNETLKAGGWKVLRFWSTDVRKDLDLCLKRIEKELNER